MTKQNFLIAGAVLLFRIGVVMPVEVFAEPKKPVSMPYSLASHPIPPAEDTETVLPKQVGEFVRGEIDGDVRTDDEVYANYRAGSEHVFVSAAVTKKVSDARDGVKTAEEVLRDTVKRQLKSARRSLGGDPSFYFVSEDDVHFIAWSRKNFYFSVDSKTGQASLDKFMSAFPY